MLRPEGCGQYEADVLEIVGAAIPKLILQMIDDPPSRGRRPCEACGVIVEAVADFPRGEVRASEITITLVLHGKRLLREFGGGGSHDEDVEDVAHSNHIVLRCAGCIVSDAVPCAGRELHAVA